MQVRFASKVSRVFAPAPGSAARLRLSFVLAFRRLQPYSIELGDVLDAG
jgi:hypothetical protein